MILQQPIIGDGYYLSPQFNFMDTPGYSGVRQIEVTIFNCPQWNIAVRSIRVYENRYTRLATAYPTTISCDSLVKVCIPLDRHTTASYCNTIRAFTFQPCIRISCRGHLLCE
jgi:hypothetical protein